MYSNFGERFKFEIEMEYDATHKHYALVINLAWSTKHTISLLELVLFDGGSVYVTSIYLQLNRLDFFYPAFAAYIFYSNAIENFLQ